MGIERIYVFVGVYIFFFAQVFVCSEHKLAAPNENTSKTSIKESSAKSELLTKQNVIYTESDKYDILQEKEKEKKKENNERGYKQTDDVLININETSLVNSNLKNKRKLKTQNNKMINNDHVIIQIPEPCELPNTPLNKTIANSKGLCVEFALECNNIPMCRMFQGLTTAAIIIIILHFLFVYVML